MEEESAQTTPAGQVSMVELSLKGSGLAFAREIPEQTAIQIMALAMGSPIGPLAPASPSTPFEPAAARPTPTNSTGVQSLLNETVGEYIARHMAQRNVEKIAAIAMFLKEGAFPACGREGVRQLSA